MEHTLDTHESRLRSALKAITYRLIGTFTTFAVTYTVTGELTTALGIGSIEPFLKMAVYYLHERAWQQVPHGAIRHLAHSLASRLRPGDPDGR